MLNLETPEKKQIELTDIAMEFIETRIEFDKHIGRDKNFLAGDYKATGQSIGKFKELGCRVFIGGGNIFILKVEKKLDGWQARIMQSRGLAHRVITIKENMGAIQ